MSDAQGNTTSTKEPAARMKQLVEMSHNIVVDPNIPVTRYFNSGRELIKSAAAYQEKGDLEKAFVLYLRYMTLFLEKIVHHPGYSKADRNEKTLVKNECNAVFDLAENLKKRILEKYASEYEKSNQDPKTVHDEGSLIQKRSIGPDSCSKPRCDIDEIDEKFNFSQLSDDSERDKVFDPFNIEELQKSFNETRS